MRKVAELHSGGRLISKQVSLSLVQQLVALGRLARGFAAQGQQPRAQILPKRGKLLGLAAAIVTRMPRGIVDGDANVDVRDMDDDAHFQLWRCAPT